MSKQHILSMERSIGAATTRPTLFFIALCLAGLVVLAAFLVIHVIGQLDTMSSDLDRVRGGLANLTTMNVKLDKLSSMSQVLHHMDGELAVTNQLLTSSNKRLAAMSADSRSAGSSMAAMTHTLELMRGDIHLMSRKLSGSFLFRSVK